MYLRKMENPEGAYTDALGNRYDVCGARRVRTAQASLFEEYPTLEDALKTWGLQRIETASLSH